MKVVRIILIIMIIIMAIALWGCSAASSLKFSSESYTVKSGISFVPNIKIRPKQAQYQIVSDNSSIASVENNIVSAKKEGVVTLTITSGKKQDTATLYILDETDFVSTDITIKDAFYISFVATNFEIANLESEILQTVAAIEGNILTITMPYVKGYAINGWYTDRECTKKYDENTIVSGAFRLYCYLTEQTNSFMVVNKLITGITYDNLEHSVLDLPAAEDNGNEIIGIADNAFKNDKKITKVIVPDNYIIIGASAFAGCANLEEIVLGESSNLEDIGTNAFGTVTTEDNEVSCGKLKTMLLPNTVKHIGAYAFYKCTALELANIPSSLFEVTQYSFYGTRITAANLANVDRIWEGAFASCTKLATVTNTSNVIYCDKDAFSDAGFYLTAYNKYHFGTGGRKDSDALIYADTILIGCYPKFGTLLGSGKIKIDDKTTLIANEAFLSEQLTELTINIDTEIARQVITESSYNFLGKNVFLSGKGVSIVVGNVEYSEYLDRYSTAGQNYKEQLCVQEIIEVVGADNEYQINWGTHTLLKFARNDTFYYHYDKFTPWSKGLPRRIDIGIVMGERTNLDRINSNAINNIANLRTLNLHKPLSIAYFAVSNCENLNDIDLTSTVNVTVLEHASSIQFSTLKTSGSTLLCKVYVKDSDYNAYRSLWAKFITAYNSLERRV